MDNCHIQKRTRKQWIEVRKKRAKNKSQKLCKSKWDTCNELATDYKQYSTKQLSKLQGITTSQLSKCVDFCDFPRLTGTYRWCYTIFGDCDDYLKIFDQYGIKGTAKLTGERMGKVKNCATECKWITKKFESVL